MKVSKLSTAGHVELENVSFSYPNTEQEVISNISLEVKPGNTVAARQ